MPKKELNPLENLEVMAYLPWFLMTPRTTSPGVSQPTVSWAFPHQSLRKHPIDLPTVLFYGDIFSTEAPSSEMTLAVSS